jgi:predicted extracellular nuclease
VFRRRAFVVAAVCAVAFGIVGAAMPAPSTTVVVSEFRVRGPQGGNDEFIELYNVSSSPVAIGGWKVNGSNNAGTTSTRATITSGKVLGPGCHYLLANSSASGYSGAVTPDQTYTTGVTDDGGIGLLDGSSAVVDQVGMSAGSAYKEGTTLASLGSTNADRGYERKPGGAAGNGTDTDNNATDFQLVTPSNPQSTASACIDSGASTSPAGAGSATPSSVDQGGTTLLTVVVTPGTNPASEGLAVSGDLSAIGGPAAAAFHDDGADGDAAAGDNIFSYAATVAGTTQPGAKSLPFTVSDSQSRSSSGTIALTVSGITPIGTIQGSVSDTDDGATFDTTMSGATVTVQGVVTELTYDRSSSGSDQNGFYLQNTPATADADPSSSDGIFVFMGRFTDLVNGYVPTVGDEIKLTGRVSEFFHMTELSSATATKIGTATITPFVADPPNDSASAARYWERREGMLGSVPADSVVDSPTHRFASTGDTEFYAIAPTNAVAQRANPYAQRAFRDVHPSDDDPGFNGNGFRILVTDEGIKTTNHETELTPVHTFQKLAAPVTGGVYFAFGKYSISASAQPAAADGADPAQNDPPQPFDRSQAYSVANFNMENLYDFRDDPFDGCDFTGNSGCPGVSPPFDYVPASDAEYQGRLGEIAHQVVGDLHSPDVIVVAEAEDQDICTVANGALSCGTTNNADGQPDDLEELALKIQALGGPAYSAAFDRNGADARGIVAAFMYRTDRVQLLPAAADDAVLGSSPAVQYRTPGLAYNNDVSNPKALNAVLPADIENPNDTDGSNVFTRAVQVAHFRVNPIDQAGSPSDIWVLANHFSSGPDTRVGQRREQAAYNAAVVQAIQGQEQDAKVMVAGDLNVFPRPDDPFLPGGNSDQLKSLYDIGMHNLYDTVIADNPAAAYSYVFDGQAQDLDHQFVTESWFKDLRAVNEAHINSDWPRVPGSNRGTSDHDPMVSQWALKLDTAPTVDAGGPYTVDEGSTVTLTATADDVDGDPVSYAWDLDGDGVYETPGQSVSFHAGDGPDTRSVSVQATDSPFGLATVDTATIDVANVAPTATFNAAGSATAGDSVDLSFTNPDDPFDTVFEYAFDCGAGYGAFGSASTTTCANVQQGTLSVGGKVRDDDGGVREYRSTITVHGRSPVVSAGGPYTVDEGGTVTLDATGSDPDGDAVSYAWDLDGNGTFETSGQSVPYHAGDGPATATVSVQATDATGATGTSSATVTVANVPPTATFNAPAKATVGIPFGISLTDPRDPVDTAFTYAFDCGDGTGFGAFGSASTATCKTFVAGALTVRGAVRDKDGGTTEYTKTVVVGVTFDGVCEVVKAYASSAKAAQKICDLLAEAEADQAKGKTKQVARDLADAAAQVVLETAKGTFTLRESAAILALIAQL